MSSAGSEENPDFVFLFFGDDLLGHFCGVLNMFEAGFQSNVGNLNKYNVINYKN